MENKMYDPENRFEILQREKQASLISKHVYSMTDESLHDKFDIAVELAYRDLVISQLVKLNDELSKGIKCTD